MVHCPRSRHRSRSVDATGYNLGVPTQEAVGYCTLVSVVDGHSREHCQIDWEAVVGCCRVDLVPGDRDFVVVVVAAVVVVVLAAARTDNLEDGQLHWQGEPCAQMMTRRWRWQLVVEGCCRMNAS